MRQLWTLGIRDKQPGHYPKILKAPVQMPDGTTIFPTKGTHKAVFLVHTRQRQP